MENPNGRHWGYGLSKASGVRSGVLYPMLTRLLRDGLVTDGWEDPNTITEKRPPRRYYELTDDGRRELGRLACSTAAVDGAGIQLGWSHG